jgi:hypothetical protein
MSGSVPSATQELTGHCGRRGAHWNRPHSSLTAGSVLPVAVLSVAVLAVRVAQWDLMGLITAICATGTHRWSLDGCSPTLRSVQRLAWFRPDDDLVSRAVGPIGPLTQIPPLMGS